VSITPLRFVGISTYSQDFQSILNRAVAIASLPIQQLQNQQSDLLTKKLLLGALNSDVTSLANAVAGLGTAGANKALSASSTNSNRVAVSLNGASVPASYIISEISSVAAAASENTASGYASAGATAVDVDNDLELVVGGNTYALDLTSHGNHLNGLAEAINALGLGLNATVLNTGSGPTPYYLSLTATSPGATTLELRTTAGAAGSNILTATNQGTNAVFKLNGLTLTRPDNVVTDAISGLTFTIVSKTSEGETVGLNLTSSRGSVAGALQTMVAAYNSVRTKLDQQIGERAGLLSGDHIIRQTKDLLRKLTGYEGTGTVKSLAALGVQLSKTGEMSFDASAFYGLSTDVFNAAFTFLGSAETGFGGQSKSLRQLSDPVTGFIKTQQNTYDAADQRMAGTIATLATRIDNMQQALSKQLQQADVLLSSLQNQQQLITASLESLQLLTFGKKT